MKKLTALLLALIMVLTLPMGVFAADTKPVAKTKLTATELKIANAYLKTLQTMEVKHLDPVKYPGMKYKAAASLPEGLEVGILRPTFSKKVDAKKVPYIEVAGLLVASDGESLSISEFSSGIQLKSKNSKVYSYYETSPRNKELFYETIKEADQDRVFAWLSEIFDEDTAFYLTDGTVFDEGLEGEEEPATDDTSAPPTASGTAKLIVNKNSDYGNPKEWSTVELGGLGYMDNLKVLDARFSLEIGLTSAVKDNDGYAKLFPDKYSQNSAKFDFYKVGLQGRTYNVKTPGEIWVDMLAPSAFSLSGYSERSYTFGSDMGFPGAFDWDYSYKNTAYKNKRYSESGRGELNASGYAYVAVAKGETLEYVRVSVTHVDNGFQYFFLKVK